MELDKCITRAESASTQLKSSIIKDIQKIADAITTTYKVTKTEAHVDSSELAVFISGLFSSYNVPQSCQALTKNGTLCTGQSCQNSKYCKRHQRQGMISQIMSRQSSSLDTEILMVNDNSHTPARNSQTQLLKKQFIDDTFYFVDDKYIYHQDTLNKVGYIAPETNDYILTDDPFELGDFSFDHTNQ